MPRLAGRAPKYRHYKPKDLAVVRIGGRDVYLGKYDSPESRAKYHRLIAEWLATGEAPQGPPQAPAPDAGPSVNEVILAFLKGHAAGHYRHADGTPTGEYGNFLDSLKPLRRLYGPTPAARFSPKGLKAVRQAMIDSGLSRGTINQRVGRIVHVFKWAVSEEIVGPEVHQGLKSVAGLQRGRSAARETQPVRPVPDAWVDAVKPAVSRQVWAMVELQRLSGMRPGEVTIMRTSDLDTSGAVWVYSPRRHKTEHHGQERRIYLGPQAQAVLKPWLRLDLAAYLFSPREAAAELRTSKRGRRASPVQPSQRDRRKPGGATRPPGDHYSTQAYYIAVRRGCLKAGVEPWGPNRLRHNAATLIRKQFGLEAAGAVLGHTDVKTTAIYAEQDQGLARETMGRMG